VRAQPRGRHRRAGGGVVGSGQVAGRGCKTCKQDGEKKLKAKER